MMPRSTRPLYGDRHGNQERPRSRLAESVGPCYTADSLARALGLTIEQVSELTTDRGLLALTTADDKVVYPAFQIHHDRIVPHLRPVLEALRQGVDDPWGWALWLNSTPPAVEGIPPEGSRIQQLVDGEFRRVLLAAQRSASSWRS